MGRRRGREGVREWGMVYGGAREEEAGGEGEWPAFWDQFVSFHSLPPASALTDVQRQGRAEPLIPMH